MEETVLKAMVRSEKPSKVRSAGFVPGVLNEPDTTSTSVQFESAALNKLIARHGTNAKLWIEIGDDKKFGYIKEIQRNPVKEIVLHVAIQLVSQDKEVRMQLPISFAGRDELEHKLLQVQVYKSELEVMGKAALMPDVAIIDLSEKASGENITALDFSLPQGIRITDPEHEIYAVIKTVKKELAEEPGGDNTDE